MLAAFLSDESSSEQHCGQVPGFCIPPLDRRGLCTRPGVQRGARHYSMIMFFLIWQIATRPSSDIVREMA